MKKSVFSLFFLLIFSASIADTIYFYGNEVWENVIVKEIKCEKQQIKALISLTPHSFAHQFPALLKPGWRSGIQRIVFTDKVLVKAPHPTTPTPIPTPASTPLIQSSHYSLPAPKISFHLYDKEVPVKIPTPTPQPPKSYTFKPVKKEKPELELLEWGKRLSPSGSYLYVEGIIKNTGKIPAERVKVKITARDINDELICIEDTYTDPISIQPGESATFKEMIPYTPRLQFAEFSFKILTK